VRERNQGGGLPWTKNSLGAENRASSLNKKFIRGSCARAEKRGGKYSSRRTWGRLKVPYRKEKGWLGGGGEAFSEVEVPGIQRFDNERITSQSKFTEN